MFRAKKGKKDSGLSSPKKVEQKPPKGSALPVSNGRRSMSVSASIIGFIKPRYSFWESKKNKKDQVPQLKLEEPVQNIRDRNLKEWILSSPRSNAPASSNSKQFSSSGRVHPSLEETAEDTTPRTRILPRDAFCLEGSRLQSINDDEEVEENNSVGDTTPAILPRDAFCLEGSKLQSISDDQGVEKNDSKMSPSAKRNRKVRFKLPQVVDIFALDSADGFYYSN